MLPQRISVKLFFEPGAAPNPEAAIPLFHRWIQEATVPGLLVDVVDYSHVHHGPGVILIGHEGDYALDMSHGQPGLLYRRKRVWPAAADTLVARLQLVVARGLAAADAVAAAGSRSGFVAPRRDELELMFADRLALPNEKLSQRQVEESLPTALVNLYPEHRLEVHHVEPDPRQPLRVRVTLQPVSPAEVFAGGGR